MASVESGDAWSEALRGKVVESLLRLDTLTISEMDMILCLLPGGEFEGLAAGGIAVTNRDETVIVLGYSEMWQPSEKLIGTKTDADALDKILRGVRVTPDFADAKQQVVALFYDASGNATSDYLLLNPASLTVKTHLDDE